MVPTLTPRGSFRVSSANRASPESREDCRGQLDSGACEALDSAPRFPRVNFELKPLAILGMAPQADLSHPRAPRAPEAGLSPRRAYASPRRRVPASA